MRGKYGNLWRVCHRPIFRLSCRDDPILPCYKNIVQNAHAIHKVVPGEFPLVFSFVALHSATADSGLVM